MIRRSRYMLMRVIVGPVYQLELLSYAKFEKLFTEVLHFTNMTSILRRRPGSPCSLRRARRKAN